MNIDKLTTGISNENLGQNLIILPKMGGEPGFVPGFA